MFNLIFITIFITLIIKALQNIGKDTEYIYATY